MSNHGLRPETPSLLSPLSSPQQQQQQQEQQQSGLTSLQITQQALQPPSSQEFSQGEEIHSTTINTPKNVALSSRIGSTGSQFVSQVNEVRKRTGRRVLHRPKPLDLDHTKLHAGTNNHHQQLTASTSGSDSRPSSRPLSISGPGPGSEPGTGLGIGPASPTHKEPRHRAKFPLLHIKTDLNPPITYYRPSPGPTASATQHNSTGAGNVSNVTPNTTSVNNSNNQSSTNNNANNQPLTGTQKKQPSKWQVGLERMLKKLQRRKRAPSNLAWFAAHSTEAYLSGATIEARPGALKLEGLDAETDSLYFGQDKPPQWVVDSLQKDDLFFSDDTADLVLGLRDYLIEATKAGWDVAELKEEIYSVEPRFAFRSRRSRSVSPHESPRRSSSSPGRRSSAPASPGAASQDSSNSSRRGSKGSFDFDSFSYAAVGGNDNEDDDCYRLLDFFMAILSDIISHDCRYRVQHPRPSRPEWVLHSLVLDILLHLSKGLAHDHKTIYDIGMISLSAFPVFKNNAMSRLLDLLTDVILPSFAVSRTQPLASIATSASISPRDPASPISPSEIRVQLENNQTFAIQVHSPTDERGLLSVPQQRGPSLNSPRTPSPQLSSGSLSRIGGPSTPALESMDAHARSLISLTLLSVLQQISFTRSPLPVAKQLQKSIGGLLRIKPDLSADLLELIAVVENEKVMRRALQMLWWIARPSLGHHTLGEKFFPLDYDSILLMRQAKQERNQSGGAASGARSNTAKSDSMFSFRRGSLDENDVPRNDVALRTNSASTFRIRSRFPYRRTMPWKLTHESESIPMSIAQQEQSAHVAAGTNYLAEHELYPYMFSTLHLEDQDPMRLNHCERCELIIKGSGLYCYHCRGALHLECFYLLKQNVGVDCSRLGYALDYITRQPRNQLMYPDESGVFENLSNRTYRIRSGHHLQLVNLFSTCLCIACKLPLWGHHHQAYRCQDCSQLMHLECEGTSTKCEPSVQPTESSFPVRISFNELRQSFLDFYKDLVAVWQSFQGMPTTRVSGLGPAIPSPTTPSSAQAKDRCSPEEMSCNASILTLQLELLQTGIARKEIEIVQWTQGEQGTDGDKLMASEFELVSMQRYFADRADHPLLHGQQSASHSQFLSDFFEDTKQDQFLLFSPDYWSHFAALTKTMIMETESAPWESNSQNFGHFFSQPNDGAYGSGMGLHDEDVFTIDMDLAQEQLLADHSVRTANVTLASIFRFCMKRLEFHSSWTMQQLLQEWVKLGLLERLDGEICLFESAILDPTSSPPLPSTPPSGQNPNGLPTLFTSSYDSGDISGTTPRGFRAVHCLFPFVTAIDPTSNVEHLIHAIWRCFSSMSLSVNECGFLLLMRQCWPDPFMSDYTTERLVGCIFHWLLQEDNQLLAIHKNYTSKGKGIPGVRQGLEEQITRKRIMLNVTNSSVAGESEGGATSGSPVTTSSPVIAATTGIPASVTIMNTRNGSTQSNLFGAVGSYVMTRKLIAKKFAVPWLKRVMELDPDRYDEMVYRQIRVLEREMAPESEIQALSEEEKETFQHAQAERYLEFIIKFRQAGFLLTSFPKVLCRWLGDVEEMMEGMDLSSASFKTLNRLFFKASSLNKNGAVVGVDGSSTVPGPEGSYPQQQQLEDMGETPLSTLQTMLAMPDGKGVQKAMHWLRMMVQSGVQIPLPALQECCDRLVHMSRSNASTPMDDQILPQVMVNAVPMGTPEATMPEVAQTTSDQAKSVVLEHSKEYLKALWGYIVLSPHRTSEKDTGKIVDIVLTTNQTMIAKVMDERSRDVDEEDVERVRQLLKYALVIVMYVYGCPLSVILADEIVPTLSGSKTMQSQRYKSSSTGQRDVNPLQNHFHSRQQFKSTQQIALNRDDIPVSIFLKCLRGSVLSIHGEVVKGLAVIMEHAGRVSNMDQFVKSISKEIIPCLWELLSPLYDHMVDTTLPLLIRLVSDHPEIFHEAVSCCFSDRDWEVRFCALDSVFGLFSKLDDALVQKLFFQQIVVPSTATLHTTGTMSSNKGKGVDRHRKLQQHQQRTATLGLDSNELSGVFMNGPGWRSSYGLTSAPVPGMFTQQQPQQQQPLPPVPPVVHTHFLPERLRILGPAFSYFAMSLWDKDEAIRTKAKTLLKSLQPVHVVHALKAWELHFVASAPEVQQTLLKLMTRLNNYFPGWRIMNYELVFRLLTGGTLGRPVAMNSGESTTGDVNEGIKMQDMEPTVEDGVPIAREREFMAPISRRASFASLSLYENPPKERLTVGGMATSDSSMRARRASFTVPSIQNAALGTAFVPAGEPSRSQQRASVTPAATTTSSVPMAAASASDDAESLENQLALEDDIHCSLLGLALQMVANGIEPRLDEVILLKYLVVSYLDFDRCELVSLGQGKFQVRYGEYIPRQRAHPLQRSCDGSNGGNRVPSESGHETFVTAIATNLQLILDRYIEVRPDYERDPPTLYDQHRSFETSSANGTGLQSDHFTSSPSTGGTFSSVTMTASEIGKEPNRATCASSPHVGEDDAEEEETDVDEHHHRSHARFHLPRHRYNHDHSQQNYGPANHQQGSTSQKNQQQQQEYYSRRRRNAPQLYQQHHHQHYRRNPHRRQEGDTPVVGTYFVDVILRFFGSETDLSTLPAGRLKNWLELLLIVVYKFVKEADPLSDMLVVLMKRIIEMLMIKKSGSTAAATTESSRTNAASGSGARGTNAENTGSTAGPGIAAAPAVGEASMSEESVLLAISICSTLLRRSSTMTTALLSREIKAMGKLMTKRRNDPDDPVLIRARDFLHDAFVHFMGNGLFLLVFKTQPALSFNSNGWEDEYSEIDQDLDLFYVLATVLSEDEFVSPDPTATIGPSVSSAANNNSNNKGNGSTSSTGTAGNTRLVHIRDQPIRDIVDRVVIFRDLEPVQVSTIMTNLSLYVERVHCKFDDQRLIPDLGQFLVKLTKYATEWDHHRHQKHKNEAQTMKQAQEQQQNQQHQRLLGQQHHPLKRRGSQGLFSGNTSTMVSNESSFQLQQQLQHQMRQQLQGVVSMASGSSTDAATTAIATPIPLPSAAPGMMSVSGPPGLDGEEVTNVITPETVTPATTMTSTTSSTPPLGAHVPVLQQADQQSTATTMPVPTTPPSRRRKSITFKNMASMSQENNPYVEYGHQNTKTSTFSNTFSQATGRHPHHHHAMQPTAVMPHRSYDYHWDYVNPVLNMCAILMIQNPLEGHHLISAVRHILRQALYRYKISAPVIVRLVTAYCYMAELDFSLALVNVFGEFMVQELKNSILNYTRRKYGDSSDEKEDDDDDDGDVVISMQDDYEGVGESMQRNTGDWKSATLGEKEVTGAENNGDEYLGERMSKKSGQFWSQKTRSGRSDREKRERVRDRNEERERTIRAGMHGNGGGVGGGGLGLGTAAAGPGGASGGGHGPSGRSKILASNFHLMHHMLIWDLDPSYNKEWTRIKWDILGSMRFPPGQPILFPGANDSLRQETATIIQDWVEA
ncbi:hypothetical protein BG011_001847 [Mortierella polycephala]|uniref:Phorbol-ester/DAG-type domain-containing protein n=1 Tax=Mortierella polycephala TaxID=41804 RepID=A0A9P6U5K3_9FUNG|nr:hypothetical protein BG011_001847 [Mortierella polycephala]